MNIAKYCKLKGLNKEEYITLKNNIKATAEAIRSQLRYNGGMYYPTSKIIKYNGNDYMRCFIIDELKKLGIEFIKDNEYYRVTD